MYPHQAERLTAELARGGFDALVASSPANVAYVTGFWSLVRNVDPGTEVYAVVAPGGTALVVPAMEALAVTEGDAQADHVVCHGRFNYTDPETITESVRRLRSITDAPAATAAEALATALAAVGVPEGRIGLDDAALPAARVAALGQRLAGSTLVSVSGAGRCVGAGVHRCDRRAAATGRIGSAQVRPEASSPTAGRPRRSSRAPRWPPPERGP